MNRDTPKITQKWKKKKTELYENVPCDPYSRLRGDSGTRPVGSGLCGSSKLELDLCRAKLLPILAALGPAGGPPPPAFMTTGPPPLTGRLVIISSSSFWKKKKGCSIRLQWSGNPPGLHTIELASHIIYFFDKNTSGARFFIGSARVRNVYDDVSIA